MFLEDVAPIPIDVDSEAERVRSGCTRLQGTANEPALAVSMGVLGIVPALRSGIVPAMCAIIGIVPALTLLEDPGV